MTTEDIYFDAIHPQDFEDALPRSEARKDKTAAVFLFAGGLIFLAGVILWAYCYDDEQNTIDRKPSL